MVRKAATSFHYRDQVIKVRLSHEELLEAEIRLLEAGNDVDALKERNSDIVKSLDDERKNVDEADREAKEVEKMAKEILDECKDLTAHAEADGTLEQLQVITSPDAGVTVESLKNDIEAEQARLAYMQEANPNALRDFEKRQQSVERLREKMEAARKELEKLSTDIEGIREEWEPRLDELVSQINDAFSDNFEGIGCAGEVGVHKDDDFELWAIRIKVKFR